jgi:hypothetical protein
MSLSFAFPLSCVLLGLSASAGAQSLRCKSDTIGIGEPRSGVLQARSPR